VSKTLSTAGHRGGEGRLLEMEHQSPPVGHPVLPLHVSSGWPSSSPRFELGEGWMQRRRCVGGFHTEGLPAFVRAVLTVAEFLKPNHYVGHVGSRLFIGRTAWLFCSDISPAYPTPSNRCWCLVLPESCFLLLSAWYGFGPPASGLPISHGYDQLHGLGWQVLDDTRPRSGWVDAAHFTFCPVV